MDSALVTAQTQGSLSDGTAVFSYSALVTAQTQGSLSDGTVL